MNRFLAALALVWATPLTAAAEGFSGGPPVDLSLYATASALNDVAAAIPTPSSSVPGMETPSGAAGSTNTFRRGDAVQPRITRATSVTTVSGGTFSGTWATALPATPNIILTPVYTGSGNATCFLTAAPTTTFQGKCTVDASALLSLSIVTAGLTIGPQNAAAGMSVGVLAVPPTQ